jgi:TPR repeat protein
LRTGTAAPPVAPSPPVPVTATLTIPARNLDPGIALSLPLAFTAALAALSLLPLVFRQPVVRASFWGAAGVLLVWEAVLLGLRRSGRRPLALEIVLRPQHYLQACVHTSIFLYWGWYWREVYHELPLIAAQLLFAYAFDMLLAWSRRETYTLGFGPFPIIFSTNLFLWFKPDWFYLQFLMVAVGFLAKDLIRWNKDGRRVHIFNPSSFSLSVFSLGLILTGQTAITWGQEIANTFNLPPHIFLWIFLVALPGQLLFGVTTMTMSAVLSVCGFGLLYHWIFGTYYFIDGFIPAAVFLGMHLLFTDPSTSPRTELGRILFGITYGLAVVALYSLFGALGVPTFYDKLLPVPLLNLTIQGIDAAVRSGALRFVNPARLGQSLTPRQRSLVWMSIWAVAFIVISDPVDAYRPRRWVPVWQQACVEGRRDGCRTLSIIEERYCTQGSAWACNDLGVLLSSGRAGSGVAPQAAFARACTLGMPAACENAILSQSPASAGSAGRYQRPAPQPADYAILLQEGQGRLDTLAPSELFGQACHQRWADGCERLAAIYLQGDGLARDPEKGRGYLKQACDGGIRRACERLGELGPGHAGD